MVVVELWLKGGIPFPDSPLTTVADSKVSPEAFSIAQMTVFVGRIVFFERIYTVL